MNYCSCICELFLVIHMSVLYQDYPSLIQLVGECCFFLKHLTTFGIISNIYIFDRTYQGSHLSLDYCEQFL